MTDRRIAVKMSRYFSKEGGKNREKHHALAQTANIRPNNN
jgi:hypothetical protein